jgi:hypothetical protein
MFIRKNSFCSNKAIWFVYEKSAGNILPADFHHLWDKNKRIEAKLILDSKNDERFSR